MSDTMRSRLEESDYIFSGLKTFHELNEAFPSLLDEDGTKKPFERFLNDVQKVDETYNRNYLRAEYNFAGASAEMAARWESYEKDGDEYYLQYRTAGDDKVRPEHAALNGVTLPMSDPFWDEYYPPNGWNCRCNVVQVLKGTNAPTDRDEAYRRAQNALGKERTRQRHQRNVPLQLRQAGEDLPRLQPVHNQQVHRLHPQTQPRQGDSGQPALRGVPENPFYGRKRENSRTYYARAYKCSEIYRRMDWRASSRSDSFKWPKGEKTGCYK